MKTIFIYYSNSGNGDLVAEEIKKHDIEIYKVIRKRRMPKSIFFTILKGGFLAGLNHKDKLRDFNVDIFNYDKVIIGSPIWNTRFACPINTVLSKLDLKDKEVSFVFYSGSGEGPKAKKVIEERFKNAKYVFLKEPKKHPEELKKLDAIF